MLFFLLLATAKCYLHQYLHKSPALDNQCSDPLTAGQNYFIGKNYFYNYLTQNGVFTDLSKLSFILWVKFTDNHPYKPSGKQILFQLVDGPDDNPFVNLQLSVFVNNSVLQLGVYTGFIKTPYTPQIQLALSNTQNAKNLFGWNQILLSIDQSQQNSFINLKFYDTWRKTNFQYQAPKINGTFFNYKLSQQTRITNEALINQQKIDQRACAYIANFEYYIGWVTMDTEPFLEYSSNLVFYLKPTVNSLDQISENQIPMKSQSGINYNNNIGLKIYKNTRVEYVFKNQMDSFIFSFWMNPNIVSKDPKNPNYQLLSFTDDSLLKTAIGIGINNQLELLLYQNYNQKQLTQLKLGWSHVIAYFVQNSWDNDFNPSSKKQVYIFINGSNITAESATPAVEGIFDWSRIVIGFLFRDLQDENYVIVQEMKIFSGMALQKSQFGCLLQATADYPFCILCNISQSSNSFCQEDQTPLSTQQYLCPSGQYKSNGICIAIPVANCSRYASGVCRVCNYGFSLQTGKCIAQSLPNYQQCSTGALTCNIGTSLGRKSEIAITCLSGYTYSSPNCIGSQQQQVENLFQQKDCNLFMRSGCYSCKLGKSLKTSQKGKTQCVSQCSEPVDEDKKEFNIFNVYGSCQKICPRNATYSYDCKQKVRVIQCFDICPTGWVQINEGICVDPQKAPITEYKEGNITGLIDNQISTPNLNSVNYAKLKNANILFPNQIFDSKKSWVQSNLGCLISDGNENRENFIKQCFYPCGVCFGSHRQLCVTCQDENQYLDRQLNTCFWDCSKFGDLLKLNNKLNMTCEQKCPYGQVQQGNDCSQMCKSGYTDFFGVCVKEIPLGYYQASDASFQVCPEVCKTCVSATECTTCIGTYPKHGTMCVAVCPDYLDFDSNTCVDNCQPTDLVFETDNLNGFAFKICYKQQCGYVQANKRIFTVSHQTEALICRQPCDDGYYADYGLVKCMPCKSPCKTCQDKSDYCLTCESSYFFYHNGCFPDCPDLFKNYLTWQCVGGCDSGYTIKENNIKACLSKCGDTPYDTVQLYSYKQYCYEKPNPIGVYCDGYDCFDCHKTCYTCNGPNNNQCLKCKNLFFYQNTCVDICPNSLYSISTSWDCQQNCPVGTYIMEGIKQCFNPCPKNTYQYNGQCYKSKQTSTFCKEIEQTFVCYKCYSTCYACTDKLSTTCTSCLSGFYLWQGTCKSECPQSTYKYEQGLECLKICPSDYFMQEGLCVKICSAGFLTLGKYCGLKCPDGYYNNGIGCINCYEGCATCFGGLSTQCNTCSSGYYFQPGFINCMKNYCPPQKPYRNQISNTCDTKCPDIGFINAQPDATYCVKQCPSYYYGRLCQNQCPKATWASGYECRVCAKNCLSCYGDLISQCSSCLAGNYLDQTTCVEKCPKQRPFANQVDKKCVEGCSVYTYFAEMYCLNSCPTYLYRYELVPNKFECVKNCYPGSYISGKICLACDSKCIQCYASDANSCMICADGNYLNNVSCGPTCPFLKDEVSKRCVQTCPPTLYQNDSTKQCLTSCPNSQLNYQMRCISSCPPATYQSGLQCMPCHPTCQSCKDQTSTNCSECITGYFIDGLKCTLTCSKFYNGETFVCENSSCPKDFYLVTDTNYCRKQCPANYYRVEDSKTCLKQCGIGYYADNLECIQCDKSCSECNAADDCTACTQGYALNINICQQLCSDNLFTDYSNKKCQSACPSDQYHYVTFGKYFCLEKCLEQTYYNGQFCLDQCPFGTYSDDKNICNTCPSKCIECTAQNQCTSCQPGLVLTLGSCASECVTQILNTVTEQCVDTCPDELFLLNNQCLIACPSPTYFVYKHQCITSCPNNTFRNGQDCVECAKECLTCVGPTNSDCQICTSGYYQLDQNCIQTCPLAYYQDTYNYVCTLKCDENLYEYNNLCYKVCPVLRYFEKCVSSCPPSTYTVNHVCLDCNPICITCNEHSCLSCISGYYLYQGECGKICPNFYDQTNNECVDQCNTKLVTYMDQCLTQCPSTPQQFYSFNQVCLITCPDQSAILGTQCVQCQERCLICTSQTNCVKCEEGYFLFNGSCLIACSLSLPYGSLIEKNCVISCPDGTFYNNKQCVSRCPKKFYIQQCVDKCPDGYFGDDCSPCKSQCKTCVTYQTCTSCNPNYFLEQNTCDTQCPSIYDTIKWECTDTCNGLQLGYYCYSQCPNGSYQQGNQCLQNCFDGYYNLIGICTQCPRQCQKCTSATECQLCSISYYLNNQECLSICPKGLFSDPKKSMCVSKCPNNMFQYQTQCLYSCPKGYYQNIDKCTQDCDFNQIRIGTQCQNCPLECEGCSGITNKDCKKCSSQAQLIEKQCLLQACADGYQMVDNQCQICQFECVTCKQNKCLTCRGNRQLDIQCKCRSGYFDNGVDDECQLCPCEECTSVNVCSKCKNNLQIPNCSCDRPLNSEWCITCDVGRVSILFSYDLSEIIVDFGYLVSINLLNPFQPSNCSQWFINYEILGIDNQCYLMWNRSQVIIQLGQKSTINIGDQLIFQQDFYKDVNDQPCYTFISKFIDNTVYQPNRLIKPYIEFDNPQLISPCIKTSINQIPIWGTGQRDLQILEWRLEQDKLDDDHYFEIDYLLSQMDSTLIFDINQLKADSTYIITARYINLVNRVNTTTFKFQTTGIQKPYPYLSLNPLTANAYIFDCQVTYQNLQSTYTLSLLIQDLKNNTLINQQLILLEKFKIQVNESLLPKGQILSVTASVDDVIIYQNITLQLQPYQIKFKKQSRFLGMQGEVNARGIDPNVNDKILSQFQFTYQWVCTNLHNLEPCKSQQNQIIKFADSRILQVSVDTPNTTFAFYCNASKGNSWVVSVQKIVITNLNIESDYVENVGKPIGHLNPNDDVFILLKQSQQYAMIMYDNLLIGTVQVFGQGLQFKLANYFNSFNGSDIVTIYLIPSNDSMKYQINNIKMQGQLQISPEQGYSLDQFQITMNITNLDDLDLPLKYGFFYYFNYELLQLDVSKYSNVNGMPLRQFEFNNSLISLLSNGVGNQDVFILCQIIDGKGAVTFFNQSVKVIRRDYTYKQLVNSTIQLSLNTTPSLQSINVALEMLKSESKQVCLKQCSGVGTCIEGNCQCPPGYYFDDCSGTKADNEANQKYITDTMDQLFNIPFEDNQSYKLFINSLSYLTTYQTVFDNFNTTKASLYLGGVINNMQERIEKINQLNINLQYKQLNSFQYDSIDINQIIQMNDLKQTMQCHNLVWYNLLKSNASDTKYQLQYQTRQSIQNIMQLTLFILQPEEYVDFSGAGGKLQINRTSNISTIDVNFRRFLAVKQQYDVIQAIYIQNLYSDDGYFPYPDQIYPLYDYSIRIAGRSQNIKLQYTINYTFQVEERKRYTCITRNTTTFNWEDFYCKTDYFNKTITCNCTILAPTTIVDDKYYIVQGQAYERIKLPNIIALILFIQSGFWLIIMMIGIKKDKQTLDVHVGTSQSQIKYGYVRQLNKPFNRARNSTTRIEDVLPDQDFNTSINMREKQDFQEEVQIQKVDVTPKVAKVDKYSLQNFYFHHSVLNIIYKYKRFEPRWFRAMLLFMRWTMAISLAGLFSSLLIQFQVGIYPVLGVFLFSRVIETVINQQFKHTNFIDSMVMKIIYLIFILFMFGAALISFWIFYLWVDDQTDWILSYIIAYGIDTLLLDAIALIANKYLGEEAKKSLRKKAQKIKQLYLISQKNKMDSVK